MAGRFSLVGPGRAGSSMRAALETIGWSCAAEFGRGSDISNAGEGVELVIIATPDAAIADVAASIGPSDAVVMHMSGATPLHALGRHRAAALHPLLSLADPDRGSTALRTAYFAVAGDPLAIELAEALSGKWFTIADDDRALYHAAAAIASNHLVALLGQVERIAAEVGVPAHAFLPLVRSSIDNVAALGAAEALTGPAARGDIETIERHLAALQNRLPDEVEAYESLVAAARRLADEG